MVETDAEVPGKILGIPADKSARSIASDPGVKALVELANAMAGNHGRNPYLGNTAAAAIKLWENGKEVQP